MKIRYILSLLFLAYAGLILAQQPVINTINPISANVNDILTITGSNLPTGGNLQVNIGAGLVTNVISSTTNLIEVEIPAGATYGPVIVTNLSNDLNAASGRYFYLSYQGTAFDIANFDQSEIAILNGQEQPYDLCICDFNNDGLNDAATTMVEGDVRYIYQNTSTPVTTTFTKIALELNNANHGSFNANCADLNGDGLPELVFSETTTDITSEEVEIYLNTSIVGGAINFNPTPSFLITPPRDDLGNRRDPRLIEIADIDGDGKPDLIMSTDKNSEVDIYLNVTSGGSLDFDTASVVQLTIPAGLAGVLRVADMNDDNFPEIISAPFNGNFIYVFQNESSQGNVTFSDPVSIDYVGASAGFQNVLAADLDQDNYPEIIITSGVNDQVLVYPNNSASGSLSFGAAAATIPVSDQPFGIEAGDMDGDGDLDLILGALGGANVVEVLLNDGSLSFSRVTYSNPSSINSRNLNISDINGDAKPDILFIAGSSIGSLGFLTILTNRNCMEPIIETPVGEYCNGITYVVRATQGLGLTYQWEVKEGAGAFVVDASSNSDTLDISSHNGDLEIRVTANSDDGQCTVLSTNVITVNVNTNAPSPFTIVDPGIICNGDNLTLSTVVVADQYIWGGPDGFSDNTSGNSVTINNVTAANAGNYHLTAFNNNGCAGTVANLIVQVQSPPSVFIANDGADIFCNGATTSLRTQDYTGSGFTYEWSLDGTPIPSSNSVTRVADSSGDYTVTLIDGNGCRNESSNYFLLETLPPQSAFTADTAACVGVSVDLTATSTASDGLVMNYAWDIRDGSNTSVFSDTDIDTSYTFTLADTYDIRLTTSYQDVAACDHLTVDQITITDVPTINITASEGVEKCPSDSLRLELPQTYLSYDWSTGDTTFFTYAKTVPGETSVTVDVDMVTDVQCDVSSMITVNDFAGSGLSIISSTDADASDSTITLPDGTNSIILQGIGAVASIQWEPSNIFLNDTVASTQAYPKRESTMVTLTAEDLNSCLETTTIELIIPGTLPRNSFSPNGDNIGFEFWEVQNASTLPDGCSIYVFDSRGRNILKLDAPFESSQIWDGKYKGGDAPEGVYYFVINCDDTNLNKSGSILLGR